jgi:L-arabinose isomerase
MTQADHEASARKACDCWLCRSPGVFVSGVTGRPVTCAVRDRITAALDAVRDAERERWVEACRVAWKDAHKAATFARSWHGGHSHEAARSHEATADAIHALAKRLGVTL